MINNLLNRKTKISEEMQENQKNPEIIATTKGQNIQNLENTKKGGRASRGIADLRKKDLIK